MPRLSGDIADCIARVATRPARVDIDLLAVKPIATAASHKGFRGPIG